MIGVPVSNLEFASEQLSGFVTLPQFAAPAPSPIPEYEVASFVSVAILGYMTAFDSRPGIL